MNAVKRRLREIAWWVLRVVRPQDDEIDIALRKTWGAVGLPVASYSEDYVLPPGKFTDVLILTARDLGNPLRTVGQLKDLLR
jgi:hypothetical protein